MIIAFLNLKIETQNLTKTSQKSKKFPRTHDDEVKVH